MEHYQRSISYLDYLENGMKIRNAGFVKIQELAGQMRMEIRMTNLPDMYNGQFELCADSGGVIGQISITRGCGSCCIVWNKKTQAAGKEVNGIYLRFPERRLVQAVWEVPVWMPVAMAQKQAPMEMEQEAPVSVTTAEQKTPMPEMPPEIPKTQEIPMNLPPQSLQPPQPPMEALRVPKEKEQLSADKWEQLTRLYPQIHPFGDERMYLSIEPKDFIVLCRSYQKMVHNSFLLHGFYNYHHLLLGRINDRDEAEYYLGVPGNFYTREKMVAEMFGFEAFEGEKNPASPGDFGYYMKRVDI